ncbi:MAG: methyltransferase domain-containing protein [Bacteroidetes bacterium]|nr:methyltransferase domain-containing protein [Bacteroidota bacterium]
MMGDFEEKRGEFLHFLETHNIKPQSSTLALDLGAGNGIQSAAMADSGFQVKAIDFNHQLLSDLQQNCQDLNVEAIMEDIKAVGLYKDQKPELILCWGDTLTHLDNLQEINQFIADCADSLDNGGKLILSFRDYTQELIGSSRFIPVKSDENRILTCFLEYSTDYVTVTDLLHENSPHGWQQKVSDYRKVRVSPAFIHQCLQENDMKIISNELINRMIAIVACK